MDEILLLATVERYLNGEMSPEEKASFEDMRKKDAEVDQLVVEHTYFLQGLDSFGSIKTFKHNLYEVEARLMEEGVIGHPQLKGKAKIVSFWKKYQQNIAVAASIAGFISLLATGVMVSY